MFDIGLQELVLIFVIALLVFGPKNLPQLGRALGRAMREFRKASEEFRSTIETNLQINAPDPLPTSHYGYTPVESVPPPPVAATESGALPESVLNPQPGEPAGEPSPETPADIGEPYLAERGSKLFHSRGCGWVKRIPEVERVYFKRVAEAKEAGFAVCPVCEPWEPN